MPKAPRHGQLKTVAGHRKSVRAPLARVQRESAVPIQGAKAQLSRLLADAAVAAGGARPPSVVMDGRHCALELVDVADEVSLAAVEGLLELLELGAPALDPILAELDVGLELGLALLQLRLTLRQLEHSGVDGGIGDGSRDPGDGGRCVSLEQGSESVRLLRGDLYAENEWLRGS